MRRLNTIDLFAGAGGFSYGFANAGCSIVAAIELNNKYAATHSKNFPDCKTITGDVSEIDPATFSKRTDVTPDDVDIVIGGPPCQTFSSIGAPKINSVQGKKAKEDPRNYLYENFLQYVQYFQPEIFVMENVPTMKTKYKGHLFDNLVAKIESLGFKCLPTILNSVHYGVPQNRKRLFVVGVRGETDFKFPLATHYGPSELPFGEAPKPFTTVKDAISDLPEIFDGIREHHLPYSSESESDYQLWCRNDSGTVGNNICRMSNDRAKRVFNHMKQGDRYMDLPPEVRQILPFREDIFHDRLKRLVLDKPSWTILAHIGMDGYMYIHPTECRTLSVREAARIQSFHDSFEFVGNMREQYIQVGNSVPPLLAQALGNSVRESLGV